MSLPSIYLRLSVTDQCNLRCRYCRPAAGDTPSRSRTLSDPEITRVVEAMADVALLDKVRVTGGEPLLRRGLPSLVAALRAAQPTVELALTTNGLLLADTARALGDAGLDAVNVSLDTSDPATFREVTRGGVVGDVLRGVSAALDSGIRVVKLNAVLLRSIGAAGCLALIDTAARLRCELRFIELMPYGEGARLFDTEYVSSADVKNALAPTLRFVAALPASATARRGLYEVDGRSVVLGWITTVSAPFCAGCNRIRVDAAGRLYTCLRSAEGVDLRPTLDDPTELREVIATSLRAKERSPGAWPTRSLASLGG